MQTRTYQLYSSASQANAANVQILAPGYIHGVCWSVQLDTITDGHAYTAELSFQSALQVTTNNAQGVIDTLASYANFVTSGFEITDLNKVCMGLYIPVGVGQIIYLNQTLTGLAANAKAIIHVIEK